MPAEKFLGQHLDLRPFSTGRPVAGSRINDENRWGVYFHHRQPEYSCELRSGRPAISFNSPQVSRQQCGYPKYLINRGAAADIDRD
jgi:hypothetical protein